MTLGLTSVPVSPAAAAFFCLGATATIKADGGTVVGTEGRDVIVTTGAVDVHALGGDDVCTAEVEKRCER